MAEDPALPRVALAMGDPAGIGIELAARLVADEQVAGQARLLVIGDRRMLALGRRQAGVAGDLPSWAPGDPLPARGHVLVDLKHGDPAAFTVGVASEAGGAFALRNFVAALKMGRDAVADAVAFTPFNKQAMRMARPDYEDEVGVVTETLAAESDGREFNILEGLWNARVTSHIALKDVSARLTIDTVANAGLLAERSLRDAGVARPRLAVAALNPHAGDGGNFGREEIDIIAPAIARMHEQGIDATGPVPADTVFVRANKGEFDIVLTMYHDQGQIAMKLLGFDRGVTLLGGYAVPICTPAHGTAYDIAGKGIAHPGAARNAVLLAARMAMRRAAMRGAP
ncbi:MAG: 4-hydroxythreonine-4-phosphate dehydrogenase PdxA [Burkholderiaceae bacterium]